LLESSHPPILLLLQSSVKIATATAKPANGSIMTEATIEQLLAKEKPKRSDWVVALQDTGTDKVISKKKQLTTVFEKIQKVANQMKIAKAWSFRIWRSIKK
jgi:hypothetical protein